MIIASEDALSETVLRKLLSTVRPDLTVNATIGNRGKSYLQFRATELNRTARSLPVILLIDLDTRNPCPPEIRDAWFGQAVQPKMFFRVAVMEIESWVLADRERCAAFLGVPVNRIPMHTDGIDNPKEFLVNLARRSRRREIREDLVPPVGATTSIGPAYNVRLTGFVVATWNAMEAATSSDSLKRAADRLGVAF
jgi:hypothetical protein